LEAIVLAGGLGTRLREVLPDLPKPMAPVAGQPFLALVLRGLARAGFSRVVLSVGYKAEVEESPLGTGGAVRQSLTRCTADHVFVFNGDTYLDLETGEVEADWQKHRRPMIVVREVPDTARYGRVDVEDGCVVRFREKGAAGLGLINAGTYVLPRHALDDFAPGSKFSLETDYLAKAVERTPFGAFVTRGHFIDIGIPSDYTRAQSELAHLVG
jgi:D-glycero-alpha-D-manno-heptose 1-phosphate guanylyltransferase